MVYEGDETDLANLNRRTMEYFHSCWWRALETHRDSSTYVHIAVVTDILLSNPQSSTSIRARHH